MSLKPFGFIIFIFNVPLAMLTGMYKMLKIGNVCFAEYQCGIIPHFRR